MKVYSPLDEVGAEESVDENKNKDNDNYEKIVVLGNRSATRSAQNSTAPIDVFDSNDLSAMAGGGDLVESLKALIPSFSASRAYDGSAFVVPTTMRGGTADQTLIMLNGKRRHRSALIHLFAPPANKGAHAPDIGMIPTISIKDMEVLRDGAAAQYGSDAIAGVINFTLKDASEGGSVETTYGSHYAGEQNWNLSANVGAQLCSTGFLNLSMETNKMEHLSRGGQNPKAAKLVKNGKTLDPSPFNDSNYVQTWGRPELSGTRFFANASCPISSKTDAYAFGNYSNTNGKWSFFYRDPSNQALKGRNAKTNNPSPTNLARPYDVGFTPFLVADQNDISMISGIKGDGFWNQTYDFSVGMGINTIDYTLKNSLNRDAPLGEGNAAIRDFDTTDLQQEELHLNTDFSKELMEDLLWSYGLEFRRETYTLFPGGFPARTGIGVSGQAGTKLSQSGAFERDSYALYTGLDHDVTSDIFLQYALRFENYSDFGNTLNGKVAGYYSLSPMIGLRGTISTGFRAPTPGQVNLATTTTDFKNRDTSDPDYEEIHIKHLPASSEKAISLGGEGKLAQEKAVSASLGVISKISNNMNVSMDLYRTQVNDRIYRNEIQNTTAVNNVITDWSFYTNALDTQHTGLDVVWSNYFPSLASSLSFAYNYNTVEVTGNRSIKGKPVVRDDVIQDIEHNYPNHKFAITTQSRLGRDLNFMLRGRYYGSHYDDEGTIEGSFNADKNITDSLSQEISPTFFLDFEVAYNVRKDFTLMLGANNFLNTYPTKTIGETTAGNQSAGFEYSALSVASHNGGSWYLKGVYTF